MIVDLTISNFRSFQHEETISFLAIGNRGWHSSNFTLINDDRLAVLRSAAILGANASGKSNLLRALVALRWIVVHSAGRKDGQPLPTYEPYRLAGKHGEMPVRFEVEFVVPSGARFRYEVEFSRNKIEREKLYSFANRSRAVLFERTPSDNWETVKFGGTYKGGNRKFPFFDNSSYISRAGNDASSPDIIQEIYKYFDVITFVPSGNALFSKLPLLDAQMMRAVSEVVCLSDTGVTKVTLEENEAATKIQLPDAMPDDIKEEIILQNRMITKFWLKDDAGELVEFESDDMSDGTNRLVEIMPVIIRIIGQGGILLVDEIDSHLHSDLVALIIRLFHDEDVNKHGAQILFTTHDTSVLDSNSMRRDQIWFASKIEGRSAIKCLADFDKKSVRQDGPFRNFYVDGRFGAKPAFYYGRVKDVIIDTMVVDTQMVDL